METHKILFLIAMFCLAILFLFGGYAVYLNLIRDPQSCQKQGYEFVSDYRLNDCVKCYNKIYDNDSTFRIEYGNCVR